MAFLTAQHHLVDGSLGFDNLCLLEIHHLYVEDEVGDCVPLVYNFPLVLRRRSRWPVRWWEVYSAIDCRGGNRRRPRRCAFRYWADGLRYRWRNFHQGANSNGNISFDLSTLRPGTNLVATDSTGLTDSLLLIANTPPTAPTVAITPDPANTTMVWSQQQVAPRRRWRQCLLQRDPERHSHLQYGSVPARTAAGEVWQVQATSTMATDGLQ